MWLADFFCLRTMSPSIHCLGRGFRVSRLMRWCPFCAYMLSCCRFETCDTLLRCTIWLDTVYFMVLLNGALLARLDMRLNLSAGHFPLHHQILNYVVTVSVLYFFYTDIWAAEYSRWFGVVLIWRDQDLFSNFENIVVGCRNRKMWGEGLALGRVCNFVMHRIAWRMCRLIWWRKQLWPCATQSHVA